jgi:type II secretory pathway pseudopilin PulG
MSTGVIIAIVVVVVILIALFAVLLPRMRQQRALEQRRERIAGEHRAEAGERHRQAELAEEKARMAETEARRERAEADLHEQRADLTERGMVDAVDEPAPMRNDDRPMHEPGDDRGRFTTTSDTDRERVDEPTTGTPRRDY